MVEYSSQPASESEIGESYTETGYTEAFKHPRETADEMLNKGVNVESVMKLNEVNKKAPETSPILKKKKILKRLFLQYIRKYISNPKKYIDHPKQIRNLPSWFDDAIALFSDSELTREQKRMIREFFYGLIQYRDTKIASGDLGPDTTETNRQLGERSPYQYSEDGGPDTVSLPRESDVQKLNIMGIAKSVASQNVKEEYQPTMEDYVESGPESPLNIRYMPTPSADTRDVSSVQINKPSASGMSLESLIRPVGGVRRTPLPQPQTSVPQPVSNAQPSVAGAPKTIPIRQPGFNLTHFIMGGKEQPSIFPIRRSIPQPTIPPLSMAQAQPPMEAAQYRKGKKGRKLKPKIIRKKVSTAKSIGKSLRIDIGGIGSISKGLSLKNILGKSTSIKPVKKYTPPKAMKLATTKAKSVGALATIRNMDQVFAKIKSHSNRNYSAKDMKMPIVGDIKRQCDHAFKTNSFKTEATNMKNNYFDDIKNAYPKMKMEMEMMGDIHENHMLGKSVRGVPQALNLNGTSPFTIKRGSMRPNPVGITNYDFDLGNIYKKKKKILSDEEIFYEE